MNSPTLINAECRSPATCCTRPTLCTFDATFTRLSMHFARTNNARTCDETVRRFGSVVVYCFLALYTHFERTNNATYTRKWIAARSVSFRVFERSPCSIVPIDQRFEIPGDSFTPMHRTNNRVDIAAIRAPREHS